MAVSGVRAPLTIPVLVPGGVGASTMTLHAITEMMLHQSMRNCGTSAGPARPHKAWGKLPFPNWDPGTQPRGLVTLCSRQLPATTLLWETEPRMALGIFFMTIKVYPALEHSLSCCVQMTGSCLSHLILILAALEPALHTHLAPERHWSPALVRFTCLPGLGDWTHLPAQGQKNNLK